MNKEEIKKDNNYWKGYIQKQKEAEEICKMCKYRKTYKELKQKESILDKVTEFVKNYINDKQNEYEAIFESYVCQTDEDEHIKEKELATIKGQKQVLRNILNIIEGEKK